MKTEHPTQTLCSKSRSVPRKIALINQKGGVGKTTSTLNIGAGLARLGFKLLLVDLDAQAHLTYALGIPADDLMSTVYEVLKGEEGIEGAIISKSHMDILPASIGLSSADMVLFNHIGRERLLKKSLNGLTRYDYILFDCPPNLGLLTLNALSAATEVFVPLQAEYLSIKGLSKLRDMVEKVKVRINPDLTIKGIIPTLYDNRLKLHNDVLEKLKSHFKNILFQTLIRRNVALAEATSFGQSIFEYAPKSIGAFDYLSLCEEIIEQT